MPSSSINALHAVYRLDPSSNNLDALLSVLRLKALRILRGDEDSAQLFILSLWKGLESLTNIRDLNAWTNIRLHWHLLSAVRARTHPDILLADITTPDPLDLESITDPVVRRAADLLLEGFTQQECASRLGLTATALRKRLQRYRTNSVPLCHKLSK